MSFPSFRQAQINDHTYPLDNTLPAPFKSCIIHIKWKHISVTACHFRHATLHLLKWEAAALKINMSPWHMAEALKSLLVRGIDYWKSPIKNIDVTMLQTLFAYRSICAELLQYFFSSPTYIICLCWAAAEPVTSTPTSSHSAVHVPPPKPIAKESWNSHK